MTRLESYKGVKLRYLGGEMDRSKNERRIVKSAGLKSFNNNEEVGEEERKWEERVALTKD